MAAGYRSIVGFWVGGLGSSTGTSAGYRSPVGMWVGGLGVEVTPPATAGYRSRPFFWFGGLSSGARIEDSGLLGGKAYPKPKKFQIDETGLSYITPYQKLKALNEQIQKIENNYSAEKELSIDKQENIAQNINGVNSNFAADNATSLNYQRASALAQDEIKRLLQEKAVLMRLIDEEEAILVILASQPFVN